MCTHPYMCSCVQEIFNMDMHTPFQAYREEGLSLLSCAQFSAHLLRVRQSAGGGVFEAAL